MDQEPYVPLEDPIAEHYRRKDAELAAERQAHLDAGKSISTFKPTTIID